MSCSVPQSYRLCCKLARKSASSFYWSFFMLPKEKRLAMCALYAFSRRSDDISDGNHPADQQRQLLAGWRGELENALRGQFDNPLLPAIVDTVQRYQLPEKHLFDLLDGVAMDLEPRRFETFDELCRYCYLVASAVGLACIHIWGFEDDDKIMQPAIECGYAFQLTNILRDLKEDAQRGRIYLPLEDLKRFDYSENDLLRGVQNDCFLELMQFEIERAEQLFTAAEQTRQYLHADGQRAFGMMFSTYRSLLDEIKRNTGDLFIRRIKLGFSKKIGIAASHLFLPAKVD